jgi:hypothetical protein
MLVKNAALLVIQCTAGRATAQTSTSYPNSQRSNVPLPAHLALVASWQDLQVQLQGAGVDDLPVVGLVHWLAKDDVVAQGEVLAPGGLGHVGHVAGGVGAARLLWQRGAAAGCETAGTCSRGSATAHRQSHI